MSAPVVVLAGGTGGAKLARGMLDVVGDGELVVVANTGDDVEIYGAHVSPDPDLVSYWLADRIDERGWGLRDDTWEAMDARRAAGEEVWFNLGDEDLAICRRRAERLAEGARLTETLDELGAELGLHARVLPMSDDPVRTWIDAHGGWRPFQQFMIVDRAAGPIDGVAFRGADEAAPTPEVLAALAAARAIVIGPSNPVVSIGPILAVPGIREALAASPAPVVAVSPIVGGTVVKGPTEACLAWAGQPATPAGIAAYYGDLLDGLVADEPVAGLPVFKTGVLMDDAAARTRLARATLAYADELRGRAA